jgi:hypothetical protein
MALTICKYCNRATRLGLSKCSNCGRTIHDISFLTSTPIPGGSSHSLPSLTDQSSANAEKDDAKRELNDISCFGLGFCFGALFVCGIWAYVTFVKT